jgi:hypothetical protein
MHARRDCEVRGDEGNFGEVENYVPCSSAEKGCTHGETARCGVMREISVNTRLMSSAEFEIQSQIHMFLEI